MSSADPVAPRWTPWRTVLWFGVVSMAAMNTTTVAIAQAQPSPTMASEARRAVGDKAPGCASAAYIAVRSGRSLSGARSVRKATRTISAAMIR